MRFAELLTKVEPVYPVSAKKRGVQGAVWLDVVIEKDGSVASAEAIKGDSALVDAAKAAALQWRYRPTLLNGEPLRGVINVCVPFILRPKQTPLPCASPGHRIRQD